MTTRSTTPTFRRGKPTLNSQVDTAAVILVGDYLFAQSAILAASTNNPRVVSVFSNSLGDICDGQLMEMMDARNPEQTERQYLARIYGKTASLFGCAAETGAIIAQAPEDAISALRGYGDDLGLAFQIMDDVLDLTGGSDQLGKPAGHDLLQSTITLPVIYYLQMVETGGSEWQEIQAIVSRSRQDDEFVDSVLGQDSRLRRSRPRDRSSRALCHSGQRSPRGRTRRRNARASLRSWPTRQSAATHSATRLVSYIRENSRFQDASVGSIVRRSASSSAGISGVTRIVAFRVA